MNDISILVIRCNAFGALETAAGTELDVQVAVNYANQAQDSIRYPDHNGRPEIEPIFVILKYDDVTTPVRDDGLKEDPLTRNNRQERQQRREYEGRERSHRSFVETSPLQMGRPISWRALPVIISLGDRFPATGRGGLAHQCAP